MKLEIAQLHAGVDGVPILNGVNLLLQNSTLNVLMGQNGSGKSTVANIIMGNPIYEVTSGSVTLEDTVDLLALEPNERAKKGLFMTFQYPVEIPGLTVGKFLYRAYKALYDMPPSGFSSLIKQELKLLQMSDDFINRPLNEGFSGGEKKRMEILQMRVLKPSFVILDEIDSGLDIDAIKHISHGFNLMFEENKNFTALVVTHYRRIVEHLERFDTLSIMHGGKIVKQGDKALLDRLEEEGYAWIHEDPELHHES